MAPLRARTTHQGEPAHSAEPLSEQAPGQAPAHGGRGAAGRELRALHRTAGNRAVGRLLDGRLHPRDGRRAAGLPEGLRSGVEGLSGIAMDDVEVHYNSARPARLAARAYAQGGEIHVGPGQEALLPHEAWHIVQQKQGRVPASTPLADGAIHGEPGLEREADVMGARAALRDGPAPIALRTVPPPIAAPAQLGTEVDRRNAAAQFMGAMAKLQLGFITEPATLRNHARGEIRTLPAGSVIVYQGDLRDSFAVGPTAVEKDHVYAAVVSDNGQRTLATNPAGWGEGWVVYEKIQPDIVRSAALRVTPTPQGVRAAVLAYLQGIAPNNVIQAPAPARVDTAPRAIRAWAEKSGADLTTPMPMNVQVNGQQLDTQLANDPNSNYATIDPAGALGLRRLDPNSALFQEFGQFLSLNADAMPGTMASDHELRSTSTGGDRAVLGRQWLGSYNKGLNAADVVAISGATITNIFVNANCPTWEAYDRNTAHIVNANQVNTTWEPSATLLGQPQAQTQLINRMTKGRAGEFYLFHGTSRQNIFNISKTGFDPEFVNYTLFKGYGKTGYGTAFTDQFAKALAYAPPEVVVAPGPANQNQTRYVHYVLVAKVFAGNPYAAQDRARRTRGNLEMTRQNLNYEEARGNKPKAQGQGMPHLGQTSDAVRDLLNGGQFVHSTVQDRTYNLHLNQEQGDPANLNLDRSFRDTSLTVSDAIQMYPIYIIECTIPHDKVRSARR